MTQLSSDDMSFTERLNRHPELKARMKSILDLTENTQGDVIKADDAEKQTIKAVRQLGNDILQDWGNHRSASSEAQLRKEETGIEGNGKKKVVWHTTYGDVTVIEQIFRKKGQQFRPFIDSACVRNRGCSLPLQRVIVDFGADHAFAGVSEKLEEHYGIYIGTSTIQKITEHHGHKMHEQEKVALVTPNIEGCAIQVGEIDGCMIPIVSINENEEDKRKKKTLGWKETRLSLTHEQDSVTPKFGVVFQGNVDDAGQSLLNTAILAGFGEHTHFHGVGDGASWIANQVADKFGTQGSYLVDFYHVCEYLAEAAKGCTNDEDKHSWMETQKNDLKNNDYKKVLTHLESHIEPDDVDEDKAPVRACHRYLSNRTDQLDYKTAIEKELPIGSGEIESAHRYIIQKRLKLSGAWWKAANADSMLALRVVRANNKFDDYWEKVA